MWQDLFEEEDRLLPSRRPRQEFSLAELLSGVPTARSPYKPDPPELQSAGVPKREFSLEELLRNTQAQSPALLSKAHPQPDEPARTTTDPDWNAYLQMVESFKRDEPTLTEEQRKARIQDLSWFYRLKLEGRRNLDLALSNVFKGATRVPVVGKAADSLLEWLRDPPKPARALGFKPLLDMPAEGTGEKILEAGSQFAGFIAGPMKAGHAGANVLKGLGQKILGQKVAAKAGSLLGTKALNLANYAWETSVPLGLAGSMSPEGEGDFIEQFSTHAGTGLIFGAVGLGHIPTNKGTKLLSWLGRQFGERTLAGVLMEDAPGLGELFSREYWSGDDVGMKIYQQVFDTYFNWHGITPESVLTGKAFLDKRQKAILTQLEKEAHTANQIAEQTGGKKILTVSDWARKEQAERYRQFQLKDAVPLSRDSLKEVWGIGDAEAQAVMAVAEAAGLPTSQIYVTRGGQPGLDALYSTRTWNDSFKERLRAVNQDRKLVSDEELEHFIKSADNVASYVINHPELDFVPSDLYAALKKNSDPHYKVSLDFTTHCLKRLTLQSTLEDIQLKLGRGLTSNEFLAIRKNLKERGVTVSCGICYVDSKRMYLGDVVNEMIGRHPEVDKNLFLTQEGFDTLRRDHSEVYKELSGIMGTRGIKTPESRTEYRSDILNSFLHQPKKVERYNSRSGLRWQSWSDFELVHMLDAMQAISDMAVVGLKGHAYTKVPGFVDAMGKTGLMINMSLIPKGTGIENGKLVFDPVEGMPFEEALRLRKKYSRTAGTIGIGVSDAQTRMLLDDTRIDYVIPYHHSGIGKFRRKQLGFDWKDYTAVQLEKVVDEARNKASGGRTKVEWHEHNGDVATYRKLCDERGLQYKFPDFIDHPNYWKLLTDRKLFDNEGQYIAQEAVQPVFDDVVLNRMLTEYRAETTAPHADTVAEFLGGKIPIIDEPVRRARAAGQEPAGLEAALMSERVVEGERVPVASVEFFGDHAVGDGIALVRALKNPRVDDALHEVLHVTRRWLLNREVPYEHRLGITDQMIEVFEKSMGVKGGVWDRKAEETYAKAGIRYLRTGKAPRTELQAVFESISRWLMKFYRKITGSEIDVEVTPEMRKIFNAIFERSANLEWERERFNRPPAEKMAEWVQTVSEAKHFLYNTNNGTLTPLIGEAAEIASPGGASFKFWFDGREIHIEEQGRGVRAIPDAEFRAKWDDARKKVLEWNLAPAGKIPETELQTLHKLLREQEFPVDNPRTLFDLFGVKLHEATIGDFIKVMGAVDAAMRAEPAKRFEILLQKAGLKDEAHKWTDSGLQALAKGIDEKLETKRTNKLRAARKKVAAGESTTVLADLLVMQRWHDIRIAAQTLEEQTGIPMFKRVSEATSGKRTVERMINETMKPLLDVGHLSPEDSKQLARYYAVRYKLKLANNEVIPEGYSVTLTDKQKGAVKALDGVFQSVAPLIQKYRFMRWYENWYKGGERKLSYFRNQEEILPKLNELASLYEKGGLEALLPELQKTAIGVVEAGNYLPSIILAGNTLNMNNAEIRKAFDSLGKYHLESRKDNLEAMDEFWGTMAQKMNIGQRVQTYLRQVYNLEYLQKPLEELTKLLAPFSNELAITEKGHGSAYSTGDLLSVWAARLKGYPQKTGDIARLIKKGVGAFFRVYALKPYASTRNLFQDFVLAPHKGRMMGEIAKNPFRFWREWKRLPEEVRSWAEKDVLQFDPIVQDFLMLEATEHWKDKPVVGKVVGMAEKLGKIYPLTDALSRQWSFVTMYKVGKRAVERYSQEIVRAKTPEERAAIARRLNQDAGLDALRPLERLEFLKLVDSKKYDEAAMFLGKWEADNTNYMYGRTDKSLQEQIGENEVWTNLLTFSKGVAQQIENAAQRIEEGFTKGSDGKRHAAPQAVKAAMWMVSSYLAADIAEGILRSVFNREESRYKDYSLPDMLLYEFGGVGVSMMADTGKVLTDLLGAFFAGDAGRIRTASESFFKFFDNSFGRQLVPLVGNALSMLEGVLGYSYIEPVQNLLYEATKGKMGKYPMKVDRTPYETLIHMIFWKDPNKSTEALAHVIEKRMKYETEYAAASPLEKPYYKYMMQKYTRLAEKMKRYQPYRPIETKLREEMWDVERVPTEKDLLRDLVREEMQLNREMQGLR